MKKYIKELIILILQILLFYIYPFFAGPTDAMGMVFIIIIVTFILSMIIGTSKYKIKYLYPPVTAAIFIPTVFIHYNESALIHSLWYLTISFVGLLIGIILSLIFKEKK